MTKSKISSNIIFLYFLTIAKIVFPLLTFPYLTRVLTVDVYGMVSYVRATIIYMQIFVDFGFSLSAVKDIARIKNDKIRVGEITGDVIIAKLLLCVIGMVILLVLCVSISILQNNLLYTFLSYVVVILSVFLLDYLFRGIEEMQLVSLTFIIMKGASTLLTFVFVKGDADILWIPVLDIISSFFALFFVYVQLKKLHIKIIFRNIIYAWKSLKESFIYFISNMATTAFGGLNTMLIGIYIPDVKEIAYWSVAMTLVSGAQALYNPITGGVYPQMVKNPSMRIIKKLLLVFMPCVIFGCLFTWIFAEDIVRIINGPNYDEAAEVLRYLVPVLFFSFPGMLIGWPALGAIDKASDVTKTTVFSCIFQLAGLFLLILCNQFTLLMISILRDMTEAVLLGTRFGYLVKNRKYFVK
jgi:PST family polysaccharide transporter